MNCNLWKTAILAAVLVFSNLANAGLIYTYTGNNFTSATSPATTNDFVTATLTLDGPLASNLNAVDVQGNAGFNLNLSSSGININSDTILNYDTNIYRFARMIFRISTDDLGNISAWNINMYSYKVNTNSNREQVSTLLILDHRGRPDRINDSFYDDSSTGASFNSVAAGVWTSVDTSVVVPEPSTLAIFALGIMGLVTRRFKKLS